MNHRNFGSMMAMIAVVLVMSLAPVPATGQGGPGTRTGPHLRALPADVITPPRTPDGQPDLQGAWSMQRVGGPEHSFEFGIDPSSAMAVNWNAQNLAFNILVDPMSGSIPYRPGEMTAKRTEKLRNIYAPTQWEHIDLYNLCFPLGVPRTSVNRKMIRQLPGYVLFLSSGRETRIIPLDGRPHLPETLKLYMGDSRGHWEGNTLVIETTNNNDRTEFDRHGTFHSDALRVVERLTLVDVDTMYYEVTFEDPAVFTQPWKIAVTLDRDKQVRPDRLWENACWAGHARTANIVLEAGKRAVAAGFTGIHQHDIDNLGESYAPTIVDVPAPPPPKQ